LRRNSRGFTLAEVAIYSFLLLLLLFAIYSLYVSGRKMYEGATGSYLVSQEFEAGVRWLRADLKESGLIAVRVFPSAAEPASKPGVSMTSARSYEDAGKLMISMHGAPQWDKHVFYTLEPMGTTGHVIRWEKKIQPPSFVPLASDLLPSAMADTGRKRVVLRNVLLPNTEYAGLGAQGGKKKTDAFGGFKVQFVTRPKGGDDSLTSWNPGQVSGGEAADSDPKAITKLVEVQLQGTVASGFGRPNFYSIKFRVFPRH
jgi:hypothetical protein